ncbi:HAMP domain-containing sensor histidine kinase [Streptomyces sp. RLB1-33]|uniref:sensor histidine kinase n=1 Tax=Streptomyces mirabilis TaxID=68239 RepID=UPI00143E38F9|nr:MULTISPECIES: HAMP domain-containing sensor histidine kinase [Streptomyces]QIY72016.1 HAMP domain-containing histidine kinase [Streptomyces sp. RLB1-33]QUW81003.1 HAMP domain-containing histidine kinase [Streptomyces mirabilis]
MSGRRRPRKQGRGRQPRTLRTRLVVASVSLIAVVCAVISTVTTLALRDHLYQQLDVKVTDIAMRAVGHMQQAPGGASPGAEPGNPNSSSAATATPSEKIDNLLTKGPTQPKTVAAYVQNGSIISAAVAKQQNDNDGLFKRMFAGGLTAVQKKALDAVPKDNKAHSVEIPGLGNYLVKYVASRDSSDAYYVALPTKDVDENIDTLILVEISVTAAGLVAAGIAGYVLVGVATRPLRKVANTATRVSELPLHTGEVTLYERVPESEADPHTEVGQVGAALNRMLDHIHSALHARQQSEMRVRQFVADASHELRTPLASIRGYAELTRRGREETGPDTRHALGRIESEASRMTGLVEDLLLLARLDAGRPLQYDQTDLVPLVIDAVSDARAAGRDHNWRLELPEEPALVLADAARLQQVMVNLFANARTHTPPGTTVTARVHRHGPWLCVDVQDDGPGIPPDLLPRVFERFARGDSSRSRSSGSTGLGLAIVQAVAAAHGGAVTVDSMPGRTVFTLHLPAIAVDPFVETKAQLFSQAQHSATTWVQQGV